MTDSCPVSSQCAACASPAAVYPDGYSEISPLEAQQLLEAGGVNLLDVRSAGEFAAGHIPGALNCPSELLFSYRSLPFSLDLSQPLLIYCRSGRRARDAAPLLLEMGFKQVLNFGGILSWPHTLIQDPSPTSLPTAHCT